MLDRELTAATTINGGEEGVEEDEGGGGVGDGREGREGGI